MDYYDILLANKLNGGGGITDAVKTALLNCFAHVAWIDENGQDYYDALEDALYSPVIVSLVSIFAVYTQSGTVYSTDSLDDLKADLVVTAIYNDSTTAVITDYTLSGTLITGTTSVITVSYGGKTTTFNVTVVARGLVSGTHTFATTGETVTVTDGNHIKFEIPSDLIQTTGYFYNLSDLSLNNANSSLTADNSTNVNNLNTILFNFPSNSSYTLTISNITKTSNELINDSNNAQFILSARKTGTNTSAFTGVGYPSKDTSRLTATGTISGSTDISCFFVYLMGVKANTVEFDLSLTVNGERYI